MANQEAGGGEPRTIRIEQVRSPIGYPKGQREVLKTLGLRRIRHVVERQDTPAVRGAIKKISHLVRVVGDQPVEE
ncbi:MAG: 50S ribosomal protein L30 [Acidobacteriota bacterium]